MTNYKFDKLHHGCGEPLIPVYQLPQKQQRVNKTTSEKAARLSQRKVTERNR